MEYRDSADISGASVNRAGGSRGSAGGRIAVGGGGSLVVLILALVLGLDPSGLLGGSTGTGDTQAANPVTQCTRGSDVAKNRECRWNAYLASIGAYWSGAYEGFTASSMTTFSGQVPTGCGAATSSVGPFYCPVDQIIYIDTDYTATLLAQLGAKGGDAAEGYIVALSTATTSRTSPASWRINKENWTHGSSSQRKNWTSIGFKTGDWTRCDTFSATSLG